LQNSTTMTKYEITTDLFTLPYKKDQCILYAPTKGFACVANEDLADFVMGVQNLDHGTVEESEERFLDLLVEKGVLNGKERTCPPMDRSQKIAPSKLTLFPTTGCTMRCRYCYASRNRDAVTTMDWEIATSAIDYHASVLKEEGRTTFSLELHGGGEPFHAWQLVQGIVRYASQLCVKEGLTLQVVAGTNGALDGKKQPWVIQNFTFLNVSFDGLPDVQDVHRPMANGSSSFDSVDGTIRFLDAHNFPYALRCTVSTINEHRLPETIDFITTRYKAKLLFLEPLFACGRFSVDPRISSPDMYTFTENFRALEEVARERGLRLEYSGAAFDRLARNFCDVGTDNFAVTSDGYLTNCWEVSSIDHPLAKTFIFGRMLTHGRIEVDWGKWRFLRSLSVDSVVYCSDCFAKWHCAGDCVAKLGHDDYQGARGSLRCQTNRELIRHRIIQMLERKDYYQVG
jgi:uncharacterized protein